MLLVFKVKKPTAVVKEVRNVASPTSLNAILIALSFSALFLSS